MWVWCLLNNPTHNQITNSNFNDEVYHALYYIITVIIINRYIIEKVKIMSSSIKLV